MQAAGLEPQVEEPAGLVMKSDGNNVSIDRESRLLSENALRFSVASQMLRAQIRGVRSAIQDGKG
jgi:flagellar basal-body rod protein FlgB